jgi:hypothetical protein
LDSFQNFLELINVNKETTGAITKFLQFIRGLGTRARQALIVTSTVPGTLDPVHIFVQVLLRADDATVGPGEAKDIQF